MVDGGTGRAAQSLDRPVAGKTGTKDREDDIVSAWFVGYTKQISTAVMYVAGKGGNDDLDPYARPGDSTFFGGTYPALTWADYMAVATEGQPVEDFGGPAYVNRDKYSEPTLRPEPTETREPSEEPTETEEPEPTTYLDARAGADGDRRPRSRAPSRRPVRRPPGPRRDRRTPRRPRRNRAVEDPTATAKVQARSDGGAPGAGPAYRSTDPPSLTDGFVATVSQRFGGPLGRHAGDSGGGWWNPVRVALLTGTLVYLAGMVFRLPCRNGADHFRYLCYSDIPLLYPGRGLMQGNTPYLDSGDYPVLEYPVLTGWFLELERILTRLLGGAQGTDLTAEQQAESTLRFLDVNAVLLGGLFLLAVWAQVRTVAPRPWDGMMLAASPCVAAAALINWDMLPVALTALGMLAWSRRRPGLAGIFFGLGMAAKLYPLFLLGPLLLLCLRSRRMADYFTAAVDLRGQLGAGQPARAVAGARRPGAASGASTPTAPATSARSGTSSPWPGTRCPTSTWSARGLFALGCLGIAALIVLAPRRPRFGAVAFLVIVAFLLTNKVYSPQYVLWLLPFVVLARPRWRDWLVFTAGELIYFVAIWWHLAGVLAPGDSSADRIYWLAVIIRLRHPALGGGAGGPGHPAARSTTPYARAGWTTRPAECSTERPTPTGGRGRAGDVPGNRPRSTHLSPLRARMARSGADSAGVPTQASPLMLDAMVSARSRRRPTRPALSGRTGGSSSRPGWPAAA